MSQAEERVEYQKLMEEAHRISTRGLEDDYRALMEFNNVVLAGHQTRFGMEFVTWEWVQNHTALCQGHITAMTMLRQNVILLLVLDFCQMSHLSVSNSF